MKAATLYSRKIIVCKSSLTIAIILVLYFDLLSSAQPLSKSSFHTGYEVSTSVDYPRFEDMPLDPIVLDLPYESVVLLALCVPDCWNDSAKGARFAIYLDGEIIARAGFTSGQPEQRIPVTLVTVERLSAGTHLIKAAWCRDEKPGKVVLGAWSETKLIASVLYAEKTAISKLSITKPITTRKDYPNFLDMGLKPIELDLSKDGNVLFTLQVGDGYNDARGGYWAGIEVDGSMIYKSHTTSAIFGQKMPISMVVIKRLTAGSHTIKANWCRDRQEGTAYLGNNGDTILTATLLSDEQARFAPVMHSCKGFDFRSSAIFPDWQEIMIEPIKLKLENSTATLLVLNVPDSWDEGSGGNWIAIELDGKVVCQGVYTMAAHLQNVSATLLSQSLLQPGERTIRALWSKHCECGATYIGGWSKASLCALPVK